MHSRNTSKLIQILKVSLFAVSITNSYKHCCYWLILKDYVCLMMMMDLSPLLAFNRLTKLMLGGYCNPNLNHLNNVLIELAKREGVLEGSEILDFEMDGNTFNCNC